MSTNSMSNIKMTKRLLSSDLELAAMSRTSVDSVGQQIPPVYMGAHAGTETNPRPTANALSFIRQYGTDPYARDRHDRRKSARKALLAGVGITIC